MMQNAIVEMLGDLETEHPQIFEAVMKEYGLTRKKVEGEVN